MHSLRWSAARDAGGRARTTHASARVAASRSLAGALREERKIVIGPVRRPRRLDGTRRAARPRGRPHAAARRTTRDLRAELERFGGTVEKFIGDAVVGVFGAPVAHEDDPERAVRAALAIRKRSPANEADPGSSSTSGSRVCTGEALITVGARTSEGEATAAGDVMNTAARLQAAAPVGRRPRRRGDVPGDRPRDRLPASSSRWRRRARRSRSRCTRRSRRVRASASISEVRAAPRSSGATRERDMLVGALARARAEQEPQLVTLVGVPGIGKSRLVRELWQVVDDDPELISWRQGRCLPYGDGVAYWGLAEIVKAQAGILETDGADEAEVKLARPSRHDRRTRPRLSGSSGTLGRSSGSRASDGAGEPGEAFAAWRRFFEALAEQRPAGARLRGPALGGRRPARLRRPAARAPRAFRCSSCAPRGRNCSSAVQAGGRQAERAHGLARRRSRTTRRRSSVAAARHARARRGAAGGAPRPRRRESALRRGVRAHARRRRRDLARSARDDPGHRRGPDRPLPAGEKSLLQDASALGKVFWTDGLAALAGVERVGARRSPARARAQGVRAPRRAIGGRGRTRNTPSSTCSCAMSPTASCHARNG